MKKRHSRCRYRCNTQRLRGRALWLATGAPLDLLAHLADWYRLDLAIGCRRSHHFEIAERRFVRSRRLQACHPIVRRFVYRRYFRRLR